MDVFVALPIQATLIIAGWFVVHHLQGFQARRRMLRERVDVARNDVRQIRDAALRFHTAPAFSPEGNESLLEMIADLDRSCKLFPNIVQGRLPGINAANPGRCRVDPTCTKQLRQAITLEHFDADHNWQPLAGSAEQLADIRQSAAQMLDELDRIMVDALD